MTNNEQRLELANFLRTRRKHLSPLELGLPRTPRRKTAGLRREEVAYLAGVGVTWYTWLEQGRDIHVSTQVLESLAQTLKLTSAEKNHLFLLAGQATPTQPVPDVEQVNPFLTHFLEQMGTNPAYITGRRWDILAWNQAASEVITDFAALPVAERNIIRLLFTNEESRHRYVDWENGAQRVLAQLRGSHSLYHDDVRLNAMIQELQQRSPEFACWWSRHEVRGRQNGQKKIYHPLVGILTFEHNTFQIEDAPGLKMVVYLPACKETASKLKQLSQC